MNKKIEGMVTYGVKFTYFIVKCQGQMRQEPPFVVMVYFAYIREISKGFISQYMKTIVELKTSSEAIWIGDKAKHQKSKDQNEVRIYTPEDFLHFLAPTTKPIHSV